MSMKRTPLSQRTLPAYTRGNEIANMMTHICGSVLGVIVLVLTVIISVNHRDYWALISGSVFGLSMLMMYSVSSLYHGLRPCNGKKVLQVIDHCMIYLLIVGTYTPILLSSLRPIYPRLAWSVFCAEWLITIFGVVFTAVDHNRYGRLAMMCYLGMGWLIILAAKETYYALGRVGFLLVLYGGIVYSLGAVLYALGKKKPYMHTIFHVFVLMGSVFHTLAILGHVL